MTLPDFPSNSRRPSDESGQNRPQSEETKLAKVEGIGKVVRRKKSLGRRLLETFFSGKDGVFRYLLDDVLIPALQDTATDVVKQGIEKAVYGEVRTPRRTTLRGSSSIQSRAQTHHVGYDRVISQNTVVRPTQISSGPMRRPVTQPSSVDLGDIVLDTEFAATMIAEKLYEVLQEYPVATVANLKELLGESPTTMDHRWGWTEGAEFRVRRIRDGFLLEYPQPEDLR